MTLKKLQNIAEKLVKTYCKKYNIEPYSVKVKNLKTCGRIRYQTRYISIPLWAYEEGGVEFFTAYVLHEITHFIRYHTCRDNTHGTNFHSLEKKLLEMHNMVPIKYRISFYDELEDINGKTLWIASAKVREAKGMKPYKLKI